MHTTTKTLTNTAAHNTTLISIIQLPSCLLLNVIPLTSAAFLPVLPRSTLMKTYTRASTYARMTIPISLIADLLRGLTEATSYARSIVLPTLIKPWYTVNPLFRALPTRKKLS